MQSYVLGAKRAKRKRRTRRFRFFAYAIVVLVLCGIGAGFYAVTHAAFFTVRGVTVQGTVNADPELLLIEVRESILREHARARFFGLGHIFGWPRISNIEEVSITLPHEVRSLLVEPDLLEREVRIIVLERERYGIWCYGASEDMLVVNPRCFWFGADDAVLIAPALPTAGQLIVRIDEISDGASGERSGGTAVRLDTFAYVKEIITWFRMHALSVVEMRVDRVLEEFAVIAEDGTTFIFSLRFSSAAHLGALNAFLSGEEAYAGARIDLTVPHKLFVQ